MCTSQFTTNWVSARTITILSGRDYPKVVDDIKQMLDGVFQDGHNNNPNYGVIHVEDKQHQTEIFLDRLNTLCLAYRYGGISKLAIIHYLIGEVPRRRLGTAPRASMQRQIPQPVAA